MQGKNRSPIIHFLGSDILRANNSVIDLDFKLKNSLDPDFHIEIVCCKALKMFGFVNRLTKDFKFDSSFKILFYTLVRFILEYLRSCYFKSIHCYNNSQFYQQPEKIQRRFFRSAGYLSGINNPPHDYSPFSAQLSMQ